ncbi:DUF971 domain-containing protein [Planctomycetota bacterium]|nr:DUF971 domain-containing protein [Planctomycetota bacterium]
MSIRPKHIDLKRDKALTIEWEDGHTSVYEISFLRKSSPSAEEKKLREEMKTNPLTILPAGAGDDHVEAENIELVGNYALRIFFSDGHHTGIYSWPYLRSLDPTIKQEGNQEE